MELFATQSYNNFWFLGSIVEPSLSILIPIYASTNPSDSSKNLDAVDFNKSNLI